MTGPSELSPAKRALLALRLQELRAAQVDAAQPERDRDSVLAPIKREGSYPPLFCVHASGGTVSPYVPLAMALHREQPFYGLESVGIDGGAEPLTRVEDMAARYLDAVRSVQPSGPYRLSGWSTGGAVAFEMAQQLHRQGEEVALLALLDASAPQQRPEPPPAAAMLTWFVSDLAGMLGRRPPELGQDELRGLPSEEQLTTVIRRVGEAALLPEGLDREGTLRPRLRVFLANVAAANVYRPRRYDGEIILIRAEQSLDHSQLWQRLTTRGLVHHVVPGDHYSIFRPPDLAAFAATLQRCLEERVPSP